MPLQLGEVVELIGSVHLAGVDQWHKSPQLAPVRSAALDACWICHSPAIRRDHRCRLVPPEDRKMAKGV